MTGAELLVRTRDRRPGAPLAERGSVRTAPDGSFTYLIRAFASRTLEVAWRSHAYDARPAATSRLTLLARARATLRASTRRPARRPAGPAQRAAAVPAARVTVILQGRRLGSRRCMTFADTTTDAAGASASATASAPRLARGPVRLPGEAPAGQALPVRDRLLAPRHRARPLTGAGRLPPRDRNRGEEHVPTYFVTGATGFIGRHLVERLLAREGDIHVLVRAGSAEKLDASSSGSAAATGSTPVTGDLSEPLLGVDAATRDALRGNVDHFFHLAAIYDMTADETQNTLLNVGGTQNAIDLANDLQAGIFHHASSIAVAGNYEGHFTEDMFDEGQTLPSPYHRTKFESEKLVRTRVAGRLARVPARRSSSATRAPARWTRSTGRTTSSRRSRRRATRCRSGSRSSGSRSAGPTSCRSTGSPPRSTTSRTSPASTARRSTSSTRARSAPATCSTRSPAPATRRRWSMRVDKRMTDMLPKGVLSYAMKLPALKDIRRTLLADLGIPDTVIEHMALVPRFDGRDTQRALQGHGHRGPAARDLRREAVGLLGAQPRSRPVQGPLVRRRRQRQDRRDHRRVERDRHGGAR